MKKSPRIAVVCGGSSAEAEVSRVSGQSVASALRARFSDVTLIELDKCIAEKLRKAEIDIVFPILHGPPGEDGTFQGFLDILELPYVGSGVRASACAMDKVVAKKIFRDAGLPVARDVAVHRRLGKSLAAKQVIETVGNDVVVKPSSQGSAIGVRFAKGFGEIEKALEQAFP